MTYSMSDKDKELIAAIEAKHPWLGTLDRFNDQEQNVHAIPSGNTQPFVLPLKLLAPVLEMEELEAREYIAKLTEQQ